MSLCHMSTIMSQLCHCWNSHVVEQYTIIRLIHLRNRMTTADDTSRRTPGLANVHISGQPVRRRLSESELGVRWQDKSLNNSIGPRD
jgi:hypothetical protein